MTKGLLFPSLIQAGLEILDLQNSEKQKS